MNIELALEIIFGVVFAGGVLFYALEIAIAFIGRGE